MRLSIDTAENLIALCLPISRPFISQCLDMIDEILKLADSNNDK